MIHKDATTRRLLAPIAAAALLAPTAYGQTDEVFEVPALRPGENISFEASIDVTTAYFYRGISQGRQNYTGAIIQPGAGLSIDLMGDADNNEPVLSTHFSTWNSFATNDRPSSNSWYEADFAMGFSLAMPDGLAFDATYVWLESPQAGAEFNQEIDFTLSYDDSGLWSMVEETKNIPGFSGFQPYVLLAIETSSAADGIAEDNGTYVELGIEPSVLLIDSETNPVTLSLPTAIGLNLNNYYQQAPGDDGDFFGFIKMGAHLSTPLAMIPSKFGEWELSVGVDFLMLSDQLQEISSAADTGDESVQVIGTVGLSMSF